MTSTPVKDVGSVLSSLGAAAGTGFKPVGGVGFQAVFQGQTGRGAVDSQSGNDQAKVKKMPGDSLKAKDDHMARVSEQGKSSSKSEGRPTDEGLEEAMEVLGTAAADMMQRVADTFGVSPEELQAAMEELGMEPTDVLDREMLGALLLKLGGVQDAYALVTDGELYGKYQELMGELENLLQEAGEELNMEPEELNAALQQMREPQITVEVDGSEITEETFAAAKEPEDAARAENEQADEGQAVQQAKPEEDLAAQREETQNRGSGRHRGSEGREHHSMFAQGFRDQFLNTFRADVQQAQEASQAWSQQTRDIMRQIMDYMRIQVKPDTSSLEMQLHPESLGTLHIQVISKGGMLTANFITQNEAVKAALESQMVQLKENFEQQGVKVEAIEITVQTHAFERNLDQGRGHNAEQDQAQRKTRTRRINLDGSLETENPEEEDSLAAEMMAANGNQVDYTV